MLQTVGEPTLRDLLRQETNQSHRDLEAIVDATDSFRSPAGYAQWLVVMQRLHARFACAHDHGSARLGLPPISKALSRTLAADTGQVVPEPAHSAQVGAASIGVAYVFEGSGVGSRLLLRRVEALGDLPMRYLTYLSGASHVRWPRFKRCTDAAAMFDGSEARQAIEGAQHVFDAFAQAFGEMRA